MTRNASSLQRLLGVLDAAGGAERLLLGGVGELHAELFAVAEVVPDQRGQELHGHDGLGEPVPLEQPQDVLHDRPVDHGQQRLGHARGHRAQAGALAAGHHDGLHVGSVLLEETTVMPTSPVQDGPHLVAYGPSEPLRRRIGELSRPWRPP